ncbi:carbohydrate esterase family 4 protein [Dendrothele bispora CBS 962.96]|uniref:chitin deacetylase n=1 Tax=Dendrothele bispora (strain CBS 962.96) TaxID=1314807 RepID=A0A4S8MMN4_DENBC|nr:carbohydrate esterase family 4 protein [Dendrothele bispora CBS 962.96]
MRCSLSPPSSLITLGLLATTVLAAPPGRTTEADEALITDPDAECTGYSFQPVQDALSSFPSLSAIADIVPTDTEAIDKFNSFKDKIPNIPPKGTPEGDFTGLSYPADDPDCWWTNTQCVTPKFQGIPPDVFQVPEPLTVGYGFDDGPNCSHNTFYDYLDSENQKATMFFVGSNVMYYPLEAQRALVDGHEVCVHTWSHHYMTGLTNEQAFAELYYTIKLVMGVTPTCWRPPFGDVDDRVRTIAAGLGLQTILWQYDSFDWEVQAGGATPEKVDANYDDFINKAKNGAFDTAGGIILTHEIDNYTMSEAIKYLPKLKEGFKYIVPVGVALNKTQPYVESNYSLPTFEQCNSQAFAENHQSSSQATTPNGASSRLILGKNSVSGTLMLGLAGVLAILHL